MNTVIKKTGLIASFIFAAFIMTGCEDNNMEDAADEVGDAVENAADSVGDTIGNAADSVEDATEDAADSIKDATN
jgi:PBP1b-binding outer membrane lipoprotein LpoB